MTAESGGRRLVVDVEPADISPLAALADRYGTHCDIAQGGGRLHVTLDVAARFDATHVLDELERRYETVTLHRKVGVDGASPDTVIVDRGALTPRQREALAAGLTVGYFDVPREGDGQALADRLGIEQATASDHVRRGIRTLITQTLQH